jgi:spermidine synthase/MFS family permease
MRKRSAIYAAPGSPHLSSFLVKARQLLSPGAAMSVPERRLLFFLFFLSGFSSLVYQVVWTRMAFATFGIIAPVLSVVISVFMLGLALGAWLGGRSIDALTTKTRSSAITFYMLTELMIGVSALAVPKLFGIGETMLLSAGQMDSFGYLSLSALVLGFSILPWCICMGATFPFMMAYVRERDQENTESFSFLYLANVLGAMSGTLITAFVLVEFFGFNQTLCIAAAGNFTIAVISGCLALNQRGATALSLSAAKVPPPVPKALASRVSRRSLGKWILFSTGFTAMAMEVVWTRSFTPVLRTQVYSFALIIFAYLGATFCGSLFYRRGLRHGSVYGMAKLMFIAAVATFLPILLNDLRFVGRSYISGAVLLLSITPLCAVLGYLTPSLIDSDGSGDPGRAGNAYAVNVLGCILGPLFASYVLLPWVGERYGLILLSLPFLGFYFFTSRSLSLWYRAAGGLVVGCALVYSLLCPVDFARLMLTRTGRAAEIRRDYAASVISTGKDFDKHLFVNGIGVTALTPETKFMAHLPLALHVGKPESVLIICFGMGTSYRSALSWNIDTTAVELVPSVKKAFGYYHGDAASVLNNPKGRVVIDDGRRFLKRTTAMFDVVVTDPPPPVEAAGSSLLYSEEFYDLVKQHLNPNGIIQVWFPGGEAATGQAILRSLQNSFACVRCFRGINGNGTHILASMQPIERRTAEQVASILPTAAAHDLLEWSPSSNLPEYLDRVLSTRASTQALLNRDVQIRITDDQPYNEYFLLRRSGLF